MASRVTPVSPPPKTARERCYEEIISDMKSGLSRYYSEHPDRLGDVRSSDAAAWSLRGVSRILRILDRYAVSDLENPAQDRSEKRRQT